RDGCETGAREHVLVGGEPGISPRGVRGSSHHLAGYATLFVRGASWWGSGAGAHLVASHCPCSLGLPGLTRLAGGAGSLVGAVAAGCSLGFPERLGGAS